MTSDAFAPLHPGPWRLTPDQSFPLEPDAFGRVYDWQRYDEDAPSWRFNADILAAGSVTPDVRHQAGGVIRLQTGANASCFVSGQERQRTFRVGRGMALRFVARVYMTGYSQGLVIGLCSEMSSPLTEVIADGVWFEASASNPALRLVTARNATAATDYDLVRQVGLKTIGDWVTLAIEVTPSPVQVGLATIQAWGNGRKIASGLTTDWCWDAEIAMTVATMGDSQILDVDLIAAHQVRLARVAADYATGGDSGSGSVGSGGDTGSGSLPDQGDRPNGFDPLPSP